MSYYVVVHDYSGARLDKRCWCVDRDCGFSAPLSSIARGGYCSCANCKAIYYRLQNHWPFILKADKAIPASVGKVVPVRWFGGLKMAGYWEVIHDNETQPDRIGYQHDRCGYWDGGFYTPAKCYDCRDCVWNHITTKIKRGNWRSYSFDRPGLKHSRLSQLLGQAFEEGLKGYPENQPDWHELLTGSL